jgi:membrane associated rhomboid family serine protease
MFPLRDNIPSRRFPFVNFFLIGLNIFIFIQELKWVHLGLFESSLVAHGLIPARFFADPFGEFFSIFSSMFLHGSWGHVIGNMWFLYIFGDNVEDNLGHIRYFFYYLLMGLGAAAAQLAAGPHSQLPMVGASGAVAGVLGGYFVLHPRARVESLFVFIIFIRVIEIPAFFFLGLWFLTQMMNGAGSLSAQGLGAETGGVAW